MQPASHGGFDSIRSFAARTRRRAFLASRCRRTTPHAQRKEHPMATVQPVQPGPERPGFEPPAPDRVGLLGAVQRHPLLSFFILANALSWIAWTPYILSNNGLGVWDFTFPVVLGSSQISGM